MWIALENETCDCFCYHLAMFREWVWMALHMHVFTMVSTYYKLSLCSRLFINGYPIDSSWVWNGCWTIIQWFYGESRWSWRWVHWGFPKMVFIKLHVPIIDNRPLLMIKTFILFHLPIISYQSAFMSFWFFL